MTVPMTVASDMANCGSVPGRDPGTQPVGPANPATAVLGTGIRSRCGQNIEGSDEQ